MSLQDYSRMNHLSILEEFTLCFHVVPFPTWRGYASILISVTANTDDITHAKLIRQKYEAYFYAFM